MPPSLLSLPSRRWRVQYIILGVLLLFSASSLSVARRGQISDTFSVDDTVYVERTTRRCDGWPRSGLHYS